MTLYLMPLYHINIHYTHWKLEQRDNFCFWLSRTFLKHKRRLVYYSYLQNHHFWCIPSFLVFQVFPPSIILLSSEKLPLASLLGSPTNGFCFPSFENIFIVPLFLKDIVTGYRILGWWVFCFSTFFWLLWYLVRNLH